MSFQSDIEKFSKKVSVLPGMIKKHATFELKDEIASRTPVDTGKARASWYVTENGIGTSDNIGKIEALEHGHSKQAPYGMVRLSVQKWETIVKKLASKYD